MGNYIVRRLIIFFFMFILLTGLIYFVLSLKGDPFEELMILQPQLKTEIMKQREWAGFNDPWYVGYFKWARNILFKWDWGKSIFEKVPVWGLIATKLPVTLTLTISTLLLEIIVGIPLGIFAARRHNSGVDYIVTFISYIGISMPGFWFALLLMMFFSVTLKIIPAGFQLWQNHDQLNWFMRFIDYARNYSLPIFMGLLGGAASLSRYMRSSILEVIKMDYIRTARAKGLAENVVFYKHALRNALIPVVTIFTFILPGLFGGSVISEQIFNINGMGKMMYNALISKDIPVAMSDFTLFVFLSLISLILTDVVYALVDPKISLS